MTRLIRDLKCVLSMTSSSLHRPGLRSLCLYRKTVSEGGGLVWRAHPWFAYNAKQFVGGVVPSTRGGITAT